MVVRDGTALLRAGSAVALRILLITCRFSVFSWWFQLKSVFFGRYMNNIRET